MKISTRAAAVITTLLIVASGSGRAEEVTAFINVNVIPMTGETILEDHTVIIANGLIRSVGPSASITVPPGAGIIDGGGAYLMPGLADMHTHLDAHDNNPAHLVLYLAHGITTVRSFDGTRLNLEWRKGTADGTLTGPAILTNGPVLMGLHGSERGRDRVVKAFRFAILLLPLGLGIAVFIISLIIRRIAAGKGVAPPRRKRSLPALIASFVALFVVGLLLSWFRIIPFMTVGRFLISPHYFVVENASQARAEVRRQKKAGYDFLKIYDFLEEESYCAAVDEAKRIGFFVSGHIPNQIPLEIIATSGQAEIAHINELQSYFWIGYNRGIDIDPDIKNKEYPYDFDLIPPTVTLLRENGISVVSTIVEKEIMCLLIEDTETILAGPEYRLVPRHLVQRWKTRGRNVTSCRNQGPYRRNHMMPFLAELTRALYEGGVTITLGGAVSNEGVIPGYHYLSQFELLADAGIPAYDLLEMATKNAGMIVGRMGRDANFGTVEAGRRADLLLLAGDPLDDINNIKDQIGVMSQGRWLAREELDRMVEELAGEYQIEYPEDKL